MAILAQLSLDCFQIFQAPGLVGVAVRQHVMSAFAATNTLTRVAKVKYDQFMEVSMVNTRVKKSICLIYYSYMGGFS